MFVAAEWLVLMKEVLNVLLCFEWTYIYMYILHWLTRRCDNDAHSYVHAPVWFRFMMQCVVVMNSRVVHIVV